MTTSEEKMVEWLRQFKNRLELEVKYTKIYRGLLRCYPHILDTALPHGNRGVTERKKDILKMAINGENRPHRFKHTLGKVFLGYISKTNSSRDEQFTDKLKQLRPDWFSKRNEDRIKKVKNIQTGEVFNSATLAAKFVKQQRAGGISYAVKHGTKCGGYNWEYVDE